MNKDSEGQIAKHLPSETEIYPPEVVMKASELSFVSISLAQHDSARNLPV
ncbi:hypothetical protein [Ekhidna sp.]